MELAEFLLARIAEDEALARQAGRVYVHPGANDPMFGARKDDEIASHYWDRIADPARVLAKCAAERRLIERVGNPAWAGFQFLALPYADHPDYDEAWRP